jgi:hypothetical protein
MGGIFLKKIILGENLEKENSERENFGKKFIERYAWSVVRSASFHSSFTSSTGIDEIVGSRGSCEATKRIKRG